MYPSPNRTFEVFAASIRNSSYLLLWFSDTSSATWSSTDSWFIWLFSCKSQRNASTGSYSKPFIVSRRRTNTSIGLEFRFVALLILKYHAKFHQTSHII